MSYTDLNVVKCFFTNGRFEHYTEESYTLNKGHVMLKLLIL